MISYLFTDLFILPISFCFGDVTVPFCGYSGDVVLNA